MPYIYRVENDCEEGCYWGKSYDDDDITEVIGDHFWEEDDMGIHPIPKEDKGIERKVEGGVEICGFKDGIQAHAWFTREELKGLAILGYELKKVKVKKITAIGKSQVLAIRY